MYETPDATLAKVSSCPRVKPDTRPRKKPLRYVNDPVTNKGITYYFNPDKTDPKAAAQNAEYIIYRR